MWTFSKTVDIAVIATCLLCIAGIITLFFVIKNYSKFVENVALTAQNTELTAKNIELTHKPIVFIKGTIVPQEDSENPMKHYFVITNTGKLPARDVRAECILNQVAGTNIGIDNTTSFPVLGKATIYPNSDLVFQIPEMISWGQPITKSEAIFTIYYKSEAVDREISENMKFIFSKDTNHKWLYVGPEVDIFQKERGEVKKRLSQ
ncbi:hypothetical protein ACFLUB_03410 [Chloroflexota bacterium]